MALQRMPNRIIAPDPASFPTEFYKEFLTMLEPIFFRMLWPIRESGIDFPGGFLVFEGS